MRLLLIIFFVSIGLQAQTVTLNELKASPTAVGFAKDITGGRGGSVIKVTNLNDSGAGSLRTALATGGARIIIFEVAGTINLSSTLEVSQPNVTIAGETANRNGGGGITLRMDAGNKFDDPLFNVAAANVIISNIRFRRGAGINPESGGDTFATYADTMSPLTSGLYLRNCSFSWGTDEVVNINAWENVTIDKCIISEGLDDATHTSGPHSKGLFLYGSTNISLYRTVLAHNEQRNFLAGGDYQPGTDYEVYNNVIYNYGGFGMLFDPEDPITANFNANIVGNRYKRGTNSSASRYALAGSNNASEEYYVNDNLDDIFRTDNADAQWDIIGDEATLNTSLSTSYQTLTPHNFPMKDIDVFSADEVIDSIAPLVGAFPRDGIDTRIINDVKNGTGSIIDDNNTYGWENVSAMSIVPTDSNNDGIPDSFTSSYTIVNNAGYSALELYLFELRGELAELATAEESPSVNGPVISRGIKRNIKINSGIGRVIWGTTKVN